jgi:hypothetical protein
MDLSKIKPALGTTLGEPGYCPKADVNKDGMVDVADLEDFERHMLN